MSQSNQFNHRILLVDDEPKVLSEFKKILCPPIEERSELRDLETKLFGDSYSAPNYTNYDVVLCRQGDQAVQEVRNAIKAYDQYGQKTEQLISEENGAKDEPLPPTRFDNRKVIRKGQQVKDVSG